jgi:photosystem II stability/assembly factor-like uncharacterized protein
MPSVCAWSPASRVRPVADVISSAVLPLLCLLLAAPHRGYAQMKLLSPQVGWVQFGVHLYRSNDAGTTWTDISPRVQAGALKNLFNVQFRDDVEGWAMTSVQDAAAAEPRDTIFHTQDGGATWQSMPLHRPSLPGWEEDTVAGPASMYFLDAAHGWISMAFSGLLSPGRVLVTVDGGRTWTWPASTPPVAGEISFSSRDDGWLVSSWRNELWATHDGGEKWEQATFPRPTGVLADDRKRFSGPPIFTDSAHGRIGVEYVQKGDFTKLAIYGTKTNGKTWQLLSCSAIPEHIPYSLSGNSLILPTRSASSALATTTIPLSSLKGELQLSTKRDVINFSFADPTNGWARMLDGHLLRTQDGGVTWSDITPPNENKQKASRSFTLPTKTTRLPIEGTVTPLFDSATSTSSSTMHLSKHLGFDAAFVPLDTASQPVMATWWKLSPYYDTSLYLPAAANRQGSLDKNLTPTWVSGIITEGWGVVPIWVGLQAPCNNVNSATPGRYAVFNEATAAAQGKSEADNAVANAATFGITGSVIYLDIENYNTSDSACSASVSAFVGAWDNELHLKHFSAGVYANAVPLAQDISVASPKPDEVWVAAYVTYPKIGAASIWGIKNLPDSLWPRNQRMHQYLNYSGTSNETYGGYSVQLDRDINDANVAGSLKAKTYSSWTFTLEDHLPSNPETAFWGANDAYMGSSPFAPPQTVGAYCDNCAFGVKNVGFWWDVAGTYTSINDTVNGEAKPSSINNYGAVAGFEIPFAPGQTQGMLYISGVTPTWSVISVPSSYNAKETQAYGVNDVNEISGLWADQSSNLHGFILDNVGNWTNFSHSGTKNTVVNGINGLRQVVGGAAGHAFVYSQTEGFTDFSCPGASSTGAYAINNNDVIVGSCDSTLYTYDLATGTFTQVVINNPNDTGYGGINDANILVGYCALDPCTTTGTFDAYYAVPNP